ncbi:MAG: hypothetical protein Tsb0021_07840 [Chlamydiales bacterium]
MHQAIETAISCGRSLQSPQTGFVHYCYTAKDEGVNDTIPVYENVLFALALLRSKNSGFVMEAREIIEKLLPFETPQGFPRYLHDYPQCFDRHLSAHLLLPFYWILKRFFLVIGNDLKTRLSEVVERTIKHALRLHEEKEAPFSVAIKLAAALCAFGEYWNKTDYQKKGKVLLQGLLEQSQSSDFGTWFSPFYIGETLLALQLVYPQISDSPWKKFWEFAQATWDNRHYSYIGPAAQVYHWSEEPEPLPYDLIMGAYTENYPYRFFPLRSFQLIGALYQIDTKDRLQDLSLPHIIQGQAAGHAWLSRLDEKISYGIFEKKVPLDPVTQKGFHVLRAIWGEVNQTHSFVCQGENASEVHFQSTNDGLELIFHLNEEWQDQYKDTTEREVAFYTNRFEGMKITVNQEKANTFQLGDTVNLSSNTVSIDLRFTHLEGTGKFFGHIMPGNRPSQMNIKGANRFNAYDWVIFLRTVRRSGPCIIKVDVDFNS